MTAKTIQFPGYPTGLTLTVDVRNIASLAVLETVALTEASEIYAGTITGVHAGQLLFVVKVSGTTFDHRVRTIQDTAGPWVILTELDHVSNTGRGANLVTITVTDGTDPLENATVRLSEGGLSVFGLTNVSGIVLFALDNATYDVTVSKPSYGPNVAELIVSGATSETYLLSLNSVTPPSSVLLSTGTMVVYDEFGVVEQNVSITIQLSAGPGTDGYALDTESRTEVSDVNGYVEFTGLIRGATYSIQRGTAATPEPGTFSGGSAGNSFVVPNANSFNLPETIGAEE